MEMARQTTFMLQLLLLGLIATATLAQDPNSGPWAYLYEDNVGYVANASNIMSMSLPLLQTRLEAPNATDVANVSGFDWTQPYPGSAIQGHMAHLRVAYDVATPEDVAVNSTSTVTSLTYSIPDSMMDSGADVSMDSSWYVCRHIYISSNSNITASATDPLDHTCGFLGDQCLADLQGNLTVNWGTYTSGYMCSSLTFTPIPASCWDTFGFTRATVNGT